MEAIKTGSFYITDAFAQAVALSDVNIGKTLAIKLPIWSESAGMFLRGSDIGLSNGILDPNILVAESLNRYWLNLLRHVQKYHYDTNASGEANFAEQAFWKWAKRMSVNDNDPISIMSENNNASIMYANTASLKTREIRLHLNANEVLCGATAVLSKPTYLTVDNLPIDASSTMLNSSEQALYDKNSNSYDINESNCRKFNTEDILGSYVFNFNALLVFFENNGVQDLAGIYFVDKYVQEGAFWYIPLAKKVHRSTFTFLINLVSNGAKYLQYFAENSDLPAALSMYEQMFRTNIDQADLYNQTYQRLLTIEDANIAIREMLLSYEPSVVLEAINDLRQKYDSKYTGHVSPERMLDMFQQAIAATGSNNQFFIDLTDLAHSITDREMEVSIDGMPDYPNGSVIPSGTAISEILWNIVAANFGAIGPQGPQGLPGSLAWSTVNW